MLFKTAFMLKSLEVKRGKWLLISNKAVFRTAPATPVLSNSLILG